MYLSISSGATEIALSGTAPIRGCTYFPDTAQQRAGEWQPVTETAEVNLSGTAAAIRSTVNSLENLFLLAARREVTGVGERVFVNYKPVDTDATAYRSEITEGRVVWSTNPGLRRLGDTNPFAQIAVIWTRAYWWEGAEVEAQLSANGQAAATGGRTVTNDPASGNWVQAAAQVTGLLPTPARIVLTNNSGATRTYTRVYLALNANSDPINLTTFLQGEARASGGTVTNDATCSGGQRLDFTLSSSTVTFTWSLSQANMQRTDGRRARVLGRFLNTSGALLVKPQMRSSGGAVLWEGDELALATLIYGEWIDLGIVPLPPGGYAGAYAAHSLALVFRGTGIATLDVLQLSMLDSYRAVDLPALGLPVVNGAALVLDGNEGLAYMQAGGVNTSLPTGVGGPIMLLPGLTQRIYIVHNLNEVAGYAPIGTTFSVQLLYRPRRLTV